MPADVTPALIAFDAMSEQLERAAARELETIPASERVAGPPTATLRKGAVEVALRFELLPREAFFPALGVLGQYMRTLGELKPGYSGCSLAADVFTARQRTQDANLPPPLRVTLSFDTKGGGEIVLGRDGLLMQDEINCTLDLWRKLVRRPAAPPKAAPDEDVPQLVAFDAMTAQLEQATTAELANVRPAQRNGAAPVATYRKGTLCLTLQLEVLSRDAFLPVMEILGKYMRSFTNLRPSAWGCSVVADALSASQRRPPRTGSATTPLPAPFEISFSFDLKGGGKVTFEKDSLLMQEEINCVLDVWRKLAIRQSAEERPARDPRAGLAELGAVVFDPDPAFGEGRIAGYEDTKRDIQQTVVLPLLHGEVYVELARLTRGATRPSLPRAVLFEGPPGTGKTTMARVLASQAGLAMVYVPVESIMSKWYGESERRLDAIFDHAGSLDRSIVFLDEIDAFAGSRDGQMHEATRRILSVLLRQMQGLVDTTNVMLIGATNRAPDLDAALLSRFARTISFPLPDQRAREAIIGAYARHLGADDIARIAAGAEGVSGRGIEDACGTAERLWAGRIIAGTAQMSAPPPDVYAEAFSTSRSSSRAG